MHADTSIHAFLVDLTTTAETRRAGENNQRIKTIDTLLTKLRQLPLMFIIFFTDMPLLTFFGGFSVQLMRVLTGVGRKDY